MRFATIAGLFVAALSVSAQTTKAEPSTKELLAELTQLPTCAVRLIHQGILTYVTDTSIRQLA